MINKKSNEIKVQLNFFYYFLRSKEKKIQLHFWNFCFDPKFQPQVDEEENFDECQTADTQTKRQICTSRHQSFDKPVD